MSRYKPVPQTTTVGGALDSFFFIIEELCGECQEIVDNASDGLRETQRIQTLEETASTLDSVQDGDRPEGDDLAELMAQTITVYEQQLRGKQRGRESRAARCGNACEYGRVAIEVMREWADDENEKIQTARDELTADPDNDEPAMSEDDLTAKEAELNAREERAQEVRDYADEIESLIGDAENAEFPGMYAS